MEKDLRQKIDALRFVDKSKNYASYPGSTELKRVLPFEEFMQVIDELAEREEKLVEVLKKIANHELIMRPNPDRIYSNAKMGHHFSVIAKQTLKELGLEG
jgi:hypothetical protein